MTIPIHAHSPLYFLLVNNYMNINLCVFFLLQPKVISLAFICTLCFFVWWKTKDFGQTDRNDIAGFGVVGPTSFWRSELLGWWLLTQQGDIV